MTPGDVMSWRNHLPMADLGTSAKKVFQDFKNTCTIHLPIITQALY